MNTTDLKNALYERMLQAYDSPPAKSEVNWIVSNLVEIMRDAIITDGKVLLRRLGRLQLTTRAGRTYIVHGEEHVVGDRNTVTFKISTSLKKELNAS